jgi:hypothetical protein
MPFLLLVLCKKGYLGKVEIYAHKLVWRTVEGDVLSLQADILDPITDGWYKMRWNG